jgi:acetyltransferase-like isoleucine patch superfamily enzyme
MNLNAPEVKRSKKYPWMIIPRFFNRYTHPVSFGLFFVNWVFQRVLDLNNDIPWQVHFTSKVFGNITIGEGVKDSFAVSGGCYIQGINGIEIGDGAIFAFGVKIISADHSLENYDEHAKCRPIKIGKNCWLGANAVILPGVELGDKVVVAAGAVVTKSMPKNSVVAGVPAKVIRMRS